jgi:adenosylcobinamide-phosphate synthase
MQPQTLNNVVIYSTLALCAGFFIDLILGDPQGWPHIARGMGAVVSLMERIFYPLKNKRLGGAIFAATTLFVCAIVPVVVLRLAYSVSPRLYFILETLLCWQLMATKSLKVESDKVCAALKEKNLVKARKELSMIVGRDTKELDETGVARAAVETAAENASDGAAAPLFYIALGTALLGCVYKAVNTMDSMVGYKNERYIDFGWFAAKLDDAMNFIPSRLCAVLMICAARICRMDAKNAFYMWKKYRSNHASPNSAQTESVAAGALRVRLAGDAYYFGKLRRKPWIGDDLRPIEPDDIRRAHKLLYATSALMALLSIIVRGVLYASI